MRAAIGIAVLWVLGCSDVRQSETADSGSYDGDDAAPEDAGDGSQQAPDPQVIGSEPALGSTQVYPAPVTANGVELLIHIDTDRAMDPTFSEVTLRSSKSDARALDVTFLTSTRLEVAVAASPFETSALLDNTDYALDLTALRSTEGVPLSPDVGLVNGELQFRSGTRDGLLNHSCGHTLFGPFANVVAETSPTALGPRIDTTHTEYVLTLIENEGARVGYVRAQFPVPGIYRLYFDRDIPFFDMLDDQLATPRALVSTPAACPGITHETTLDATNGAPFRFRIGPTNHALVRVIVEAVAEP